MSFPDKSAFVPYRPSRVFYYRRFHTTTRVSWLQLVPNKALRKQMVGNPAEDERSRSRWFACYKMMATQTLSITIRPVTGNNKVHTAYPAHPDIESTKHRLKILRSFLTQTPDGVNARRNESKIYKNLLFRYVTENLTIMLKPFVVHTSGEVKRSKMVIWILLVPNTQGQTVPKLRLPGTFHVSGIRFVLYEFRIWQKSNSKTSESRVYLSCYRRDNHGYAMRDRSFVVSVPQPHTLLWSKFPHSLHIHLERTPYHIRHSRYRNKLLSKRITYKAVEKFSARHDDHEREIQLDAFESSIKTRYHEKNIEQRPDITQPEARHRNDVVLWIIRYTLKRKCILKKSEILALIENLDGYGSLVGFVIPPSKPYFPRTETMLALA
ncbi:hypothetical protein CLF_105208 [Clonorchis sinensis]|uniref:Uncharacterized protein n=1 Tax=Clonorchis sinensis TaxID=79923 RepID=G7YD74_CLOSI|nr:hypothetical protein CLF_105208 [Clonorchis sinensis]